MIQTAFVDGNFMKPVQMEVTPQQIILEFGYSKNLLAEVKQMRGRKWLGGIKGQPMQPGQRKAWAVENCQRNDFQIRRMQGQPVYAKYDVELAVNSFKFNREALREHQKDMVVHMVTRLQ